MQDETVARKFMALIYGHRADCVSLFFGPRCCYCVSRSSIIYRLPPTITHTPQSTPVSVDIPPDTHKHHHSAEGHRGAEHHQAKHNPTQTSSEEAVSAIPSGDWLFHSD